MTETGGAAEENRPVLICLLPLVLGLFGTIYNFGMAVDNAGDMGFMADPSRLLVLGSTYLAGAILLARVPRGDMATVGMGLYWLALLLVPASALWSNYPVKALINFVHLGGATLIAAAALGYVQGRPERLLPPLALLLQLMILASIVAAKAFPETGMHEETGRWQGITSNPNRLGIVGFLACWATTASLYIVTTRAKRMLLLCCYPPIAYALLGAGSVTSLIITLFVGGGTVFLMSLRRNAPTLRMAKILFGGGLLLLMLLIVLAANPNMLTPEAVLARMGRDPTLTGRTSLWEIAFMLIDERPVTGWSFDSLASVIAYTDFGFGQFHNGYLDLMVRGGGIALGLFVILALRLIAFLLRLPQENYVFHAAGLVLVLATLISNMSEASIWRETHELWVFWLVIFVNAEMLRRRTAKRGEAEAGLTDLSPAKAR